MTSGYHKLNQFVILQKSITEFFQWLSAQLGKPLPPFASAAENAARKRGLTHKRVANLRLREELGCGLKYPTFREGYATEIGAKA